MAWLIAVVVALAWWVAWWGSDLLELGGIAHSLEESIDHRLRARREDGLLVTAGRGFAAGIVGPVIVWGGFLLPIAAIGTAVYFLA